MDISSQRSASARGAATGSSLDRVRALLHRKRSHVLWEGGKEEGGVDLGRTRVSERCRGREAEGEGVADARWTRCDPPVRASP